VELELWREDRREIEGHGAAARLAVALDAAQIATLLGDFSEEGREGGGAGTGRLEEALRHRWFLGGPKEKDGRTGEKMASVQRRTDANE
jgi:hypothetical protein